MAVGDWVYDEDARRFRDAGTGKFLSRQTVLDLRDGLADGTGRTVETLTRATWVLHAAGAEACPGCVDRAREYRSIVV